ncbi:MAG: 4Fe-4S dicluster domain-containing protein, partial [Streptosporangiaceae bacterium]
MEPGACPGTTLLSLEATGDSQASGCRDFSHSGMNFWPYHTRRPAYSMRIPNAGHCTRGGRRSMGLSSLDSSPGWAPGAADEVLPQFCMQCGTCSVVCPMIDYMEHSPRVLNAMLTAGSYDEVLRSRAIWACTGCYA